MDLIPSKLRQLKCSGSAEAYESLMHPPHIITEEAQNTLEFVLDCELHKRDETRVTKAIKLANIPYSNATQDSLSLSGLRALSSSSLVALFRPYWLNDNRNVILQGDPKSGKTWVSSALAVNAIRRKKKTHFMTYEHFIEEVAVASVNGTLHELRKHFIKFDVLVVDDWCSMPITDLICRYVIDFLNEWAGKTSVILTSTQCIDAWQSTLSINDSAEMVIRKFCNASYPIELMPPNYDGVNFIQAEGQ